MAKSLSDGALRGPGEVSAAMRGAGTIGQMSVPPAWKAPAVTTVRAFDATPMTTLPGGDAPPLGAWTARDASLGGRTGWRGAPIRRTADRDDTSTLGRVTSVRDGGAP